MRVKQDFVLRQVANTWVVVPVGQAMVDFKSMLTLNSTGAVLWNELEKGTDIETMVNLLTTEYDVSEAQAETDIEAFLTKLQNWGCLER